MTNPVQQSGDITPTHLSEWTTDGVINDAGVTADAIANQVVTQYATQAAAIAATISSSVTYLRTAGYSTVGDGGDALYSKVGGTTTGGFQSADGAWWAIVSTGVVNVKQFGAVANDPTVNQTTQCQAAITYIQSTFTDGIVYFPPGNPYLVTGLTVTNAVTLVGGGVGNTSIMCRNDSTVLTMNGSYSQIQNLTVLGKGSNSDGGTFGASQPAVLMNGTEARMTHARVQGGAPCIRTTADDTYLDDVTAAQSYGIGIVTCDAVTFMSRCKIDQAWPQSVPSAGTNFAAWQSTNAYAQGVVVSLVQSAVTYYIQCTTAGTSGGSQPALANYDLPIADGSAVWKLVSRSDMDCIRISGNEFHGTSTDISGVGRFGIIINGAALTFIDQFIVGQQWLGSIDADSGSSLYVQQSELNNGINSSTRAVVFGGSWTGDAAITDNTIFGSTGISSTGIDIAGGVDIRISGNKIKSFDTGVIVRANVGNFVISTNSIVSCTVSVDVNAGTSDHYNIVNNLVNTSSAVTDNGSGVNKTLTGNN